MNAGLVNNEEKLELTRLRMLKDQVLAVITAPVDCPTAKQVRELRAAAGFVGWSARQVRATGTLHPMHRSLTEVRMHGGASTNADVLAVMGDDHYAVPSRIKDVVDSLKLDERLHGKNPERSTVDFPHAIAILEAQAARLTEARAAVAELIEAAHHVAKPAPNCDPAEWASDRARLIAALARCKGGANP